MKKLIIFSVLFFLQANAQYDSLVDIYNSKRQIIKIRVHIKEVESILKNHKGDTIYLEQKINGRWYERRFVRRKYKNLKI